MRFASVANHSSITFRTSSTILFHNSRSILFSFHKTACYINFIEDLVHDLSVSCVSDILIACYEHALFCSLYIHNTLTYLLYSLSHALSIFSSVPLYFCCLSIRDFCITFNDIHGIDIDLLYDDISLDVAVDRNHFDGSLCRMLLYNYDAMRSIMAIAA